MAVVSPLHFLRPVMQQVNTWLARPAHRMGRIPDSLNYDNEARTVSHISFDDIQIFEAVFTQFEGKIYGYLWRMVNDEQVAHDLTQETFLRAWQHFAQIQAHLTNGAWLFRVAANLALNHLRGRAKRATVPLDDTMAGSGDPGRYVVERDLVQQTLQTLSPKQRSALILHEVYGFTCNEVATTLGMSHNAVKMALWRGREQFRVVYLREEND